MHQEFGQAWFDGKNFIRHSFSGFILLIIPWNWHRGCSTGGAGLPFLPKIPPLLHLHSLEILAPPGFEPNSKGHLQLLNQLTLPALQGFQFSEASFPATSIPAIKNLITRSGCPAHCLCIIVEDAEHSTHYYRRRFPDIGALVVNGVDAFYGEDEDVEDSDSGTGRDTDTDTEGDDDGEDSEESEDVVSSSE
ncbi:hypothetical protein B0H19DRAFT_1080081 [Mycena capillaripes]|nr:hypothetical protein B0H19DRAFT_1080081 [Mycena capillaripes]